MTLEPIRTHHRLGQWNRWQVWVSVQPRHLTKRLRHSNPPRANVRHVGTVYAESRTHATQLAKQALNGSVRSLDHITKLAKLTANPPTEREYQAWLRQVGNGSVHPTCGPLLDGHGYPVACFLPC